MLSNWPTTARTLALLALSLTLILAGAPLAAAHESYEVQPGDTLSEIARDHGVAGWRTLLAENLGIDDPHLIHPGQRLRIPGAEAATDPASVAGVWERLAACESSGDWNINTGNGYYGGLQFSLDSWRLVGGSGYPHRAAKAEQIRRAERLLDIQGWGAWPACSAELGLR